ncbi:MAG: squalene/phytoene synthase family protein [Candidatus ainarchaeum sp.]|nr:squalene/phytoene synthase family protein [Candidatus ainarchaeum sp.]
MLPKVSRSFALCIQVLPKPIDEQMMTAYLLYRVIDTIEDCDAPLEAKKGMFDKVLDSAGRENFDLDDARKCRDELRGKISAGYETELLANFDSLMRLYYSQPPEIRKAIGKWGRVMAAGMYEFLQKDIRTFSDQNKYSYYVAGVVGYLINDILYYNKVIDAKLKKKLRAHARRFGLALQKVNILRDVARDIKERRHYWPEYVMKKYRLSYENICLPENRKAAMKMLRAEIKDSLRYLHSAMFYIVSLPKNAVRVRMFCAIPLFMAIESFAKCNDNQDVFDSAARVKISRLKVYEIVAKSWLLAAFNGLMVGWFFQSLRGIPMPPHSPLLNNL